MRRSCSSNGPTVQVRAPNPNSGLGQGVFGSTAQAGSGYSQQWNLTVQKTIGNDLNMEVGYLGSKNTRLGIPDANMNQLPALPGHGLRAADARCRIRTSADSGVVFAGAPIIAEQQLLRPYPAFHHRGAFPRQCGQLRTTTRCSRKLEKRLSRGLT